MPIDRIKNMSDAALLARLQTLVAGAQLDEAALRRVVEDVRARDLSLPPWIEAILEDQQDDVPLDGVVALPDGTFRVEVSLTRQTYAHLLEIATLMDETSVERDAGAIIGWAVRRILELHRDAMPPPPNPRR